MYDSPGPLVKVQVLGPVEVVVGASRTRLSRLQRHLIAAMAVESGRVVSVDVLCEALWGMDQPRDGRNRIQALVSSLRRLLGEDAILTRPPGYLFNPGRVVCDCDLFERDLPHPGRLERALGLWRGAAFSGARDPRTDIAAARLEELRLEATERLFEQRLESGRPGDVVGDVVPQLTGLLAEHPFRERIRALLMTALHRAGRTNDALGVYREGYRLHQEELGVEPGAQLRELHRSILSGEQGAARPALRRILNQLPPATPHFTGRERESAVLAEHLTAGGQASGPSVIAINGMGGLGKTSLAVHAARKALTSYPDGCLFADLRGVDASPADPFLVMGGLVRALGGPGFAVPDDHDERLGLFRSLTAERRLLVLLDNASGEEQVRPLLPSGEGCAVVITSRRPLAGLDGAVHVSPGLFDDSSSVALLRAIAGEDKVSGEPQAALRLAGLCSGLPLAVRIVGSRVVQQGDAPLEALVERLADERARLTELTAGDREVRAVLAMSHERLDAEAARLLCLLARLPVSEMPAWVAAHLLGVSAEAGAKAMLRLSAASLLSPRDDDRFHLHDLVRLYASQRSAQDDSDALRRCYEELLSRAIANGAKLPTHKYPASTATPLSIPDGDEAVRWFRAESELLLGAAVEAGTRGWHDLAWRLVTSMTDFITLERFVAGWSSVARRVMGGLAPSDMEGRGAVLLAVGLVLQARGDAAAALQPLREARRVFVREGDRVRAAAAATRPSMVYRTQGQWRVARAAVEWALGHLPADAHPAQVGWANLALGNLLLEITADLPSAREAMMRGLHAMREGGDRAGEGNVLVCLAQTLRRQGETAEARLRYQEAAEILTEIEDPLGLSVVEGALARIQLDNGDLVEARRHAEKALALAESLYYPLGMKFALSITGLIQLRSGDHLGARQTLRKTVEFARPLSGAGLASALHWLGQAEAGLGNLEAARSLGQESLELYVAMSRPEAQDVRAWLEGLDKSQ